MAYTPPPTALLLELSTSGGSASSYSAGIHREIFALFANPKKSEGAAGAAAGKREAGKGQETTLLRAARPLTAGARAHGAQQRHGGVVGLAGEGIVRQDARGVRGEHVHRANHLQ